MNAHLRYVYKHWRVLLLACSVVLAVLLLSGVAFMRWHTARYVGNIVAIDTSILTIASPRGHPQRVQLDERTRFRTGRTTTANLSIGDTVMVVGDIDDTGIIHARMVRVITVRSQPTTTAPVPPGAL